MEKERNSRIIVVFAVILLIFALLPFAMPVIAKDPPHTPNGSIGITSSIGITNDIIRIEYFGETGSDGWYYPPTSYDHCCWEEFAVKGDGNPTVWASNGDITQYYPDTGSPDICYDAVIEIDLDDDYVADISVTRTVMVPSGEQYFYVKYQIENIKSSAIDDFKFYQGVDYDVERGTGDEGGYDASDFVWEHDLDETGITYVGFKSDIPSSHHTADYYGDMWDMIADDTFNDKNYYLGDTGVALEWDFGQLGAGDTEDLTLKFAFADSYDDLADILSTVDPLVCLWSEINAELDALIDDVSAADMPNIIKQRLLDKLEYAKELKENAHEEYEAGNIDAATKKLGVAKNQVESFASMVKITRRISSEDKESFLADAAEIIDKIDELIEYIETGT